MFEIAYAAINIVEDFGAHYYGWHGVAPVIDLDNRGALMTMGGNKPRHQTLKFSWHLPRARAVGPPLETAGFREIPKYDISRAGGNG